jgi:drug/metabolite transporter (DMT)-like permease
MSLNPFLFLLMSLIWGLTWLAVKVGIDAAPPIFFAAIRYALVSGVLLATVRGTWALFARPTIGRVLISGALVNIGTYSLLFWGMQFVTSGIASLINMSLIPVTLFGLAVLVGDERPSWRYAFALVLGVSGLVVLFAGRAQLSGTPLQLWGAAAIVAATFCYCLGSILARPLLRKFTPLQVTAAHALIGAIGLASLSVMVEPLSVATLRALASPRPLAGLLFLVVFGTIVAYRIFLGLVRDWGAPRAGLYAFISPPVALIVGAIVLHEPLGWRQVAGTAILLTAAAIAVRRQTSVVPAQ